MDGRSIFYYDKSKKNRGGYGVFPLKYSMKNSTKSLLTGLLGGAIGGVIVVGGAVAVNSFTEDHDNVSGSDKKTETSDVNYNVNSDITKAVDKVQGAVVSVINLKKAQSQSDILKQFGDLFGEGGSQDQGSNRNSKDSDDLEEASEGSGVIYKKDGKYAYIVTNNHVIDGSDSLQVLLNNGDKVKAKLIGKDAYSDLAVLRIDSKDVKTVATFGNSNKLKVGEPAIAIGSPLGSDYANTVTEGIISAKNRSISTQNDSGSTVQLNAIQTDAAINPGNSGGPLINIAGQVIGINSIKISNADSSTSVEGMGFAIPSNDVVNIINQLEKNGKVERPALGVTMIDLSYISPEQQEKILNVPSSVKEGVVVRSVQAASPAEKAGLKQYDVITEFDGHKITSATDLQSQLYQKQVGDTVDITYYHEKEKKTASVKLTLSSDDLKNSNASHE